MDRYIIIFFILLTALAWLGSFGVKDVLVLVLFGLPGGGLYLKRCGRKETHPMTPAGQTAPTFQA